MGIQESGLNTQTDWQIKLNEKIKEEKKEIAQRDSAKQKVSIFQSKLSPFLGISINNICDLYNSGKHLEHDMFLDKQQSIRSGFQELLYSLNDVLYGKNFNLEGINAVLSQMAQETQTEIGELQDLIIDEQVALGVVSEKDAEKLKRTKINQE